MFSMSVDGPLAAFVDMGGFVHDQLTVTEVRGVRKQGAECKDHAWYPG